MYPIFKKWKTFYISHRKWVGSSMFDLDASVVFPAIPPAIPEIDRLLPLLGCKSGGGGLKWTDLATNSTWKWKCDMFEYWLSKWDTILTCVFLAIITFNLPQKLLNIENCHPVDYCNYPLWNQGYSFAFLVHFHQRHLTTVVRGKDSKRMSYFIAFSKLHHFLVWILCT